MARAIQQVTDELAAIGLLTELKAKKKGRKVQFYQKTTWDDLTDDAKNEAERLQIPRSVFEWALSWPRHCMIFSRRILGHSVSRAQCNLLASGGTHTHTPQACERR